MKFVSVYTPDPKRSGPMNDAQMAEMEKLVREMTKSGALILTGGVLPTSTGGARIRAAGSEITVDGPFAETKELVGGFAILEAKSREEAIGMTTRFIKLAGDGECELHQIQEYGADR
jgi:hypothetical protein